MGLHSNSGCAVPRRVSWPSFLRFAVLSRATFPVWFSAALFCCDGQVTMKDSWVLVWLVDDDGDDDGDWVLSVYTGFSVPEYRCAGAVAGESCAALLS